MSAKELMISRRNTGLIVQISRGGGYISKSFYYCDYDPEVALALAIAWRDEQLAAIEAARPPRKPTNIEIRQQHSSGICPRCNQSYETHWKCRHCTCHGHAIPRSRVYADVCSWCADEGKVGTLLHERKAA